MLVISANPDDLNCGHEHLPLTEIHAKVKQDAESPATVGFFCPHGFSIARLSIYNMEAFRSLVSPEALADLGIKENPDGKS